MSTSNNAKLAKTKVAKAIEATRSGTERRVDESPLAVLVGGLAVGLVAGALLPKTEREKKVLGPIGKRITETASAAAVAARDVGKQELAALAPGKGSAKAKAQSIVSQVIDAARDAGREAAKKSG